MLWFVQVIHVVDRLFVAMFDSLNNNFAKELEAVGRQYPFEPLKVIIYYEFQDLGILGLQHSVWYMMVMDDWSHEFLCCCFFKHIYHTRSFCRSPCLLMLFVAHKHCHINV